MKDKRGFYGIILKFVGAFAFTFYDPILSLHLTADMHLRDEQAFLGFSLLSLTFSIGSFVFGKMSEHGNKQAILTFSLFLFSFSIYISGGMINVFGEGRTYVLLGYIGLAGAGFF